MKDDREGCTNLVLPFMALIATVYFFYFGVSWESFDYLGVILLQILFAVSIFFIPDGIIYLWGLLGPVPDWLEDNRGIIGIILVIAYGAEILFFQKSISWEGLIIIAIVTTFFWASDLLSSFAPTNWLEESVKVFTALITLIALIYLFYSFEFEKGQPLITETPTPTGTMVAAHMSATPSQTSKPHLSPTITPDTKTYETTWHENDERFSTLAEQELLRVGSLEFEYTPFMQTATSETFYLEIYIPQQYASADPFFFERIFLPSTPFNKPNNLFSFTTNVLVYPIISAQLESTDFRILPLDSQSTKIFDVTNPSSSVNWRWVVQAPNTLGKHALVLSVFIDKIPDPSWTGSFAIEVYSPTPTPAPTSTWTPLPTYTSIPTATITMPPISTPTPTRTVLEEVGNNLKSNSTTVLLWLLGIIGTLLAGLYGLLTKRIRRVEKIKNLEKKLDMINRRREELSLVDEIQEQAELARQLEDEISQLKSIAWWQFWK